MRSPFPFLLASVLVLAGLAALPGLASAEDEAVPTVSVTTSLGKLQEDDERNLRARGRAPVGSKLTIRFYRGKRLLDTDRETVRRGRYKSFTPITRTGSYKVTVSARTRAGETIKVTARLDYGPKAEAPSAPEDEPEK